MGGRVFGVLCVLCWVEETCLGVGGREVFRGGWQGGVLGGGWQGGASNLVSLEGSRGKAHSCACLQCFEWMGWGLLIQSCLLAQAAAGALTLRWLLCLRLQRCTCSLQHVLCYSRQCVLPCCACLLQWSGAQCGCVPMKAAGWQLPW